MAAVKKKDKVPLNLMDRQALRTLRELRRVSKALMSVGRNNTLDDVLAEATFAAEVKKLLIVAIETAKTFPSNGQMSRYLGEHMTVDDEAIDAMLKLQVAEATKTMFSEQATQPCRACGQHLCGGCGKCHDCEHRKSHPLN